MQTEKNKQNIVIVFMFFLVGGIFFFLMPDIHETVYLNEYLFVLCSYFIVGGCWCCYIVYKGIYLFEPITMVMSLTLITFSVQPLISILADDTDLMDFHVYGGCFRATLVYVLASIVFLVSYYHPFVWGEPKLETSYSKALASPITSFHVKEIYFFYACAAIGVGVLFVDVWLSGYSLSYMFTWGASGERTDSDSSLGVFINLRYLMVSAFIYLDIYGKNRYLVWFFRALAIMALLMRTTRWFLIVLLMSPIVYFYISTKKRINWKIIVSFASLFAFIIGAMQFTRGSVRDGGGVTAADWSAFDFFTIWNAFSGNFDLYKTLYGAVIYFPKEHYFTLGQQLIYLTLVTCIPRSIWPGKPASIIDSQLKRYFLGDGAVRGHWAYAQLTELYVEFGIVGIVVGMFLFAKFCRWLKALYTDKRDIDSLVLYSFMFPMLMQLVIRGYMPINFWAMFFMCLPVYLKRYIKHTALY